MWKQYRRTCAEVCVASRAITVVGFEGDVEATVSQHLAYGPGLLRRRNPELGGRWSGVPEVTDGEAYLVAKLEHELDHLHRSLATSCGRIRHQIHSRQVHCFFSRMQVADDDEEVVLPFGRSPTVSPEAKQHVRDMHRCRLVDQVLVGSAALRTADRESVADAVNWYFREALEDREPVAERKGIVSASDELWPTVTYQLGGRTRHSPLGCLALLEVFAVFREVNLRLFGRVGHEDSRYLLSVPAYQQAGHLWKSIAGGKMAPSAAIDRPGWDDLPLESRQTYPLEFYAACDLALWIPLSLHSPSGKPCGWRDIHPGWRFLQSVKALGNSFTPTSMGAVNANMDQRLESIQEEICSKLDWPTPRAIVEEWLKEQQIQRADSLCLENFIQDDRPRMEGTSMLLQHRLRHPSAACVGYLESRNNLTLYFSVVEEQSGGLNDALTVTRTFDENTEADARHGYRLPASYAAVRGCELYAFMMDREAMDVLTKGRYGTVRGMGSFRAAMDESLSAYAGRHYGFRLESPRTGS